MELIILGSMVSLWLTYSTAKAYQLHKFNSYMQVSLLETYTGKIRCININKSYDNIMKSPAWDFNFKDMVEYENNVRNM